MVHAILSIEIPDSLWIGAISRAYPEAEIRVLSAVAGADTGVGLVEITCSALDAMVAEIETVEETRDLTVLGQAGDTGLVQFETTEPTLLFPIVGSGIPLEMPFGLQDGAATWEITTSQERLSQLGEELSAFQITYTVEEVRERLKTGSLLTDRQRALVETAHEMGYYDSPRKATLTDVAAAADIAKSTCSETLKRAESRIIGEYLAEQNAEADFY
ncbi:bacterio-opsin activator HTH domain-containing protein [Halodesulfurarchaeum formicicum]|uniref:Bacterio-opsin activator HTH domain-containing protein n=1 Tax=Halodesulfurarchaeum formicicum TaxID=1873524 RepID=A0A1D8S6H8_9EURY|nr:helix-turn-helix domain-containing protein [Halodesulfurarchaeum formicicum]AOW80955.1 bacterio-opsin activator HTH domain-containing protein [Halodesulfurarchaeum formicicum]